jgi:hypothetical protein
VADVVDPATGVRLERLGPEVVPPGQAASFALTAPGPLPQTQVVAGPFSVTWIQKNVLFTDAQPAGPAIDPGEIAGAVAPNLLYGGATAALPGEATAVTKAAGIINELSGVLPVAVPVTPSAPVLSVSWRICRPSAADQTKCDLNPSTDLQEGTDFLAPDGLASLSPSFIFAPWASEDFLLTSQTVNGLPVGAQAERWLVRADVTLTVGSASPTVPPLHLPIRIPPLAIPTLVLMCTRPNFNHTGARRRALLLLVPGESGLAAIVPSTEDSDGGHRANVEAVQVFLEGLRSTLVGVASVGGAALKIASFLLGLKRAINLIRAYRSAAGSTYVRFRIANATANDDGIRELHRINFPNDDFEDTVSSLLFIGPKGRKVECFQHRDFNEDRPEGELDLIAREQLVVAVADLRVAAPVGEPPAGIAAADSTVVVKGVSTSSHHFDDVFSSVRFGQQSPTA